jgi:anti-sigma factor RsiW
MQIQPHCCEEFLQVASDYLEGDLEPLTAQAVAAHLRRCPGCLRQYAELALTITAVRNLGPRVAHRTSS